jgi:hypothetical protein
VVVAVVVAVVTVEVVTVTVGGAVVVADPFDTLSRTREPFGARVPPFGFWATTRPRGCGAGTLKIAGTKPAFFTAATASLSFWPTTAGTGTL